MAAETLDDLILARGLPLGDLVALAGLNAYTLYRLRNGLQMAPRVATLTKLAKVLRVKPARVRAACEASRRAVE